MAVVKLALLSLLSPAPAVVTVNVLNVTAAVRLSLFCAGASDSEVGVYSETLQILDLSHHTLKMIDVNIGQKHGLYNGRKYFHSSNTNLVELQKDIKTFHWVKFLCLNQS